MKKIENKKFNFEKFDVAKLKNQKLIFGGTGINDDDDGATNTGTNKNNPVKPNNTSIPCAIKDLIVG